MPTFWNYFVTVNRFFFLPLHFFFFIRNVGNDFNFSLNCWKAMMSLVDARASANNAFLFFGECAALTASFGRCRTYLPSHDEDDDEDVDDNEEWKKRIQEVYANTALTRFASLCTFLSLCSFFFFYLLVLIFFLILFFKVFLPSFVDAELQEAWKVRNERKASSQRAGEPASQSRTVFGTRSEAPAHSRERWDSQQPCNKRIETLSNLSFSLFLGSTSTNTNDNHHRDSHAFSLFLFSIRFGPSHFLTPSSTLRCKTALSLRRTTVCITSYTRACAFASCDEIPILFSFIIVVLLFRVLGGEFWYF